MYPVSKQPTFVSMIDRLGETTPEVAAAFRGFRNAVDQYGPLTAKQRELCLLAGFAAGRNQAGFRVHCTRAKEAGASLAEIEQAVLLMLGTNLGLAPVVETLRWAHEEIL